MAWTTPPKYTELWSPTSEELLSHLGHCWAKPAGAAPKGVIAPILRNGEGCHLPGRRTQWQRGEGGRGSSASLSGCVTAGLGDTRIENQYIALNKGWKSVRADSWECLYDFYCFNWNPAEPYGHLLILVTDLYSHIKLLQWNGVFMKVPWLCWIY